jgi:hypothetical protein
LDFPAFNPLPGLRSQVFAAQWLAPRFLQKAPFPEKIIKKSFDY